MRTRYDRRTQLKFGMTLTNRKRFYKIVYTAYSAVICDDRIRVYETHIGMKIISNIRKTLNNRYE